MAIFALEIMHTSIITILSRPMKRAIVLLDFEVFVLQRRGLNTKLKSILEDKKNEREELRERERK